MAIKETRLTLLDEFRLFFWGIVGMLCVTVGFFHSVLERALAWGRAGEGVDAGLNAVANKIVVPIAEPPSCQVKASASEGMDQCCSTSKSTVLHTNFEQKLVAGRALRRPLVVPRVKIEHNRPAADHNPPQIGIAQVHRGEIPPRTPPQHPTEAPVIGESQLREPEKYHGGIPYNCNMGFEKNDKWYAVARGHSPGIYRTWPEAQRQTNKFSNARHKSFKPFREAILWMQRELGPRGAAQSIHRLNCHPLGVDDVGHTVFRCDCCAEIFCSNDDVTMM